MVFLDTNILLDTLLQRDSFSDDANIILTLGENGTVDLYMSALSVTTIAYVIKNVPVACKKKIIRDLVSIVKVLPSLPEHVNNMLESPMTDIEDALQVQSAKEGNCQLIVTRNTTDFKDAGLPAITPKEFLERIIG